MDGQPDDCQKPAPCFCIDCGHSFWISRSCNERGCPVCSDKWAWLEAGKASRRLWTKRAFDRKRGIYTRIHHIAISIRFTGQSYKQLKSLARKVARRHGVDGELSIYHQWRRGAFDGTIHFHLAGLTSGFLDFKPKKDEKKAEWLQDSQGNWSWFKGCPGWDDDQDGVRFVVIPNKSTPDKPYAGIPSVHELRKIIAYQLGHCSIMESKHSVIWSGSVSYNKWSQDDVDQFEDAPPRSIACPRCGSFNTEPCDQWDIIPTFTHQNWENRSEMGWIQIHPYPEEPPPPRRKVKLILVARSSEQFDQVSHYLEASE